MRDLLARVSAELAFQPAILAGGVIGRWLPKLCSALGAAGVALWMRADDGAVVMKHATGRGSAAHPSRLSANGAERILDRLGRDGTLVARLGDADLDVIPRRTDLRRRTGPFLAVPLRAGGELLGWMGIVRRAAGGWPRILVRSARLAGELFASALVRERVDSDRKRLLEGLGRVEEETQRRISRNLHDVTAQDLVAVTLELEQLERALPALDGVRAQVADCRALCGRALREIRTMSHFLDLPELAPGLVPVLQLYVERYSRCSGVRVDLDLSGAHLRPPPALEKVLFLAVRELLSNVHRHSGSPTASIRLATDRDGVSLEVRDYGCGLRGARPGVGLSSMRQRLREVNGELTVTSGSGTTATVRVPWPTAGSSLRAAPPTPLLPQSWIAAPASPAPP